LCLLGWLNNNELSNKQKKKYRIQTNGSFPKKRQNIKFLKEEIKKIKKK